MTVTADLYTREAPGIASTLGLFAGEWSSRLPGALGALGPGPVPLFEDNRIEWLVEQVGGVADMRVLELGPLEAGHTYMLQQAGAADVLSIESNSHAYLKCLIVKELLGLDRAHFLFGDFMPWFDTATEHFDLSLASGVLYHMVDPLGLLGRLARSSDRVFLWTHYYDREIIEADPRLRPKFSGSCTAEVDGERYTLHRQDYLEALQLAGFCGGSATYSNWLSRADILRFLERAGFGDIRISHEALDHQNGPCFSVLAQRSAPAGDRTAPAPAAPPALSVAEAEAAVAHLRAESDAQRVRLADLQAQLDQVTGSRLWKARSRAGRVVRRAEAAVRRRLR